VDYLSLVLGLNVIIMTTAIVIVYGLNRRLMTALEQRERFKGWHVAAIAVAFVMFALRGIDSFGPFDLIPARWEETWFLSAIAIANVAQSIMFVVVWQQRRTLVREAYVRAQGG
jgi:hypothetical protein